MLTGQPMPLPYRRGPYNGPPLEQLEKRLFNYVKHLDSIHKVIFQVATGSILDHLHEKSPTDWVYIKVFKRKWTSQGMKDLTR